MTRARAATILACAVVGATGALAAACSVGLDFGGLTGGAEDAGSDVALDAARDGTATVDAAADVVAEASQDAGADAGPSCPGTAGPAGVRVGAYCVDSTEITNAQYEKFLTARGGDVSGQPPQCGWNATFVPESGWPYPAGKQDVPVGVVDWCDAYAYCKYAGKRLCGNQSGGANPMLAFADPAKSQWFKACSHNKDGVHQYPYGNAYDPHTCNGSDNDAGHRVATASLARCVGGYAGLFDMSGNVGEWEDSCGPGVDAGDDSGAFDVCRIRGGTFYNAGPDITCDADQYTRRTYRGSDVGIRCCAE